MTWSLADWSDYLDQLSTEDLAKLKKFSMAQQELSQELLEAKPLGICKITTSIGQDPLIESLEEDSREML